jgi:hypothetical protein
VSAALIDFFRSKTLQDGDRDQIAALIRDRGANDFGVREKASSELVRFGGKAAPVGDYGRSQTAGSFLESAP